jgi:hypothetical protein
MMTRHVLFVGCALFEEDLQILPMTPDKDQASAARLVGIFLDYMAMNASSGRILLPTGSTL